MSKKKPPPPLFAVKHDFYDSLDAFIQAAMMLHLAAKSALDLKKIDGPAAEIIKQRCDAFEKAMLSDQGDL